MFSGFFFTAIAIKVVKIMHLVTCPLNCDMTISAALIFSMLANSCVNISMSFVPNPLSAASFANAGIRSPKICGSM